MKAREIDRSPKAARGITRAQVQTMTAAGSSPREIALALGISTQMVYAHFKAIREQETAA